MDISDSVLRVLGAVLFVPLKKPLDTFGEENIQVLIKKVQNRFSQQGRLQYAISSCKDLQRFGYSVPKIPNNEYIEEDDEIQYFSVEECSDSVFEKDCDLYTNEMVEETLEFLENILAQTKKDSLSVKEGVNYEMPVTPSTK